MNRAKHILSASAAMMLLVAPCIAQEAEAEAAVEESTGILHKIVMYVPNRVFDVMDILRLRVRVGAGVSANARATQLADISLGGHKTVYVGLPGPRRDRTLPMIVGAETQIATLLSNEDEDANVNDPDYSSTEIGGGVQAVLVGVEVGIDPLEIVDLLAGLFFIDLTDDDI